MGGGDTMIRKGLMYLLAGAILVSLGVPRAGEGATARRDIVVGMYAEPDTLNPLVTSTNGAEIINETFLDPLVEYDRDSRLQPVLVESIPTLQNGGIKLRPDGKMDVTWRLRAGAAWQDGQPVTSADALFTNEVASSPKVPLGTYSCGVKNLIDRVQAPDARTFVVTFKAQYAFATECAVEGAKHGLLPRHVFEPVYRRDPAKIKDMPYGQDPSVTIGDGPFRFVRRAQGSEIVVEANPSYWRGRPQVDRIVFRFFPDANAIVANLLSGAIDVAAPQPVGINFAQALQIDELIQRGQAKGIAVRYKPVAIHEALFFNQANPLLRDLRVRQALAYATDRQAISEALFRGKQPATDLFLPPNTPMVDTQIRTYPHDAAKARGLLGEAGWRPGGDGIMVNGAGQRLQLVITATSGNRDRERIEQILQQQWKDAGVDLVVENAPARIVYGELFYQRRYKGVLLGSDAFATPLHPRLDVYYSREIKDVGVVSRNELGWSTPQTDTIITAYLREPDVNKRKALVSQFQRIWADEVPLLPLYWWVSVWAYNEKLQGIDPVGTAIDPSPFVWNARLWRWAQ